MRNLQVSDEELVILQNALRDEIEEVHTELRRTENHEYHLQVKRREEILERLLQEVEHAQSAPVTQI